MHYQPTHNRHEVSVQQLRVERKTETQRLGRLKASLRIKLEAKPEDKPDKLNAVKVA
jgi:hypothetical protein